MPPCPALETARLLLRPVTLDDAPAIQRIFPQWEIVRHLAARVPWPYPADGAFSHLRDHVLPGVAAGTHWCWSIRRCGAPETLIGLIDLRSGPDDNRGFWLDPAWQGRGYMSEASEIVTDYWFDHLGMTRLRVPKARANIASVRISRRQGMRVIATLEKDYVGGRMPSNIWEITAAEWRARRRTGEAPFPHLHIGD